MTFQQFLESRARQVGSKERRDRRDEWVGAVARLVAQLRAWLAESDPQRVLDVVPLEIERVEPGLGLFSIQSLKVSLGLVSVQVGRVGWDAVGVVDVPGEKGVRA